MSLMGEILEALEARVPEPKIAEKYLWPALPLIDRENLLAQMEAEGPRSKELLRVVACLALNGPDCDPWDEIRILSLGIQHMGWPSQRKERALDRMKQVLDEVEKDISAESPEQRERLTRHQANYWSFHAQWALDENHLDEAIHDYHQVLNLYHNLNERQAEKQVREQLLILETIKQNSVPGFSLGEVESERFRLIKEVAKLSNQSRLKTADLERLDIILREREDRCNELQQQADILSEQINRNTLILEFLLALARQATAPLWVEVLKVVLRQGEIDDFTIQAVHRLIPHLPEKPTHRFGKYWPGCPKPCWGKTARRKARFKLG